MLLEEWDQLGSRHFTLPARRQPPWSERSGRIQPQSAVRNLAAAGPPGGLPQPPGLRPAARPSSLSAGNSLILRAPLSWRALGGGLRSKAPTFTGPVFGRTDMARRADGASRSWVRPEVEPAGRWTRSRGICPSSSMRVHPPTAPVKRQTGSQRSTRRNRSGRPRRHCPGGRDEL